MTPPRTRRRFLGDMAAGAAAAAALPSVTFAASPTDRRLVVILLRGGLDGLALVAPYGDAEYANARGDLALPPPDPDGGGILDLDGFFGLHPAALGLHDLWQSGELSFVHAAGLPTRTRSHVEAQMVMENGTAAPGGADTGWLNRALAAMGAERAKAVALARELPLILRGTAPAELFAPPALPRPITGFFEKMALLYADDPVLGTAVAQGLEQRRQAARLLSEDDHRAGAGAVDPAAIAPAAELTGTLLARADGPRIAVVETAGWDTHTNQGVLDGRLARRFVGLSDCIEALRISLAPVWEKSLIVAVSEFGRTAIPNGTGGTDHGTGGLVLVAGGSVLGGRVHGKWPGLARGALLESRDLAATTDQRAVLKALLARHLGLERRTLDSTVFPGSAKVPPMDGLLL